MRRIRSNWCGRFSRSILLRPPRTASVTTAGCAMALYWPWLNQIYEARRGNRLSWRPDIALVTRGDAKIDYRRVISSTASHSSIIVTPTLPTSPEEAAMNGHVMDAAESTALDEKQKHWARIRESIRQRESIEVPTPQPGIRSVRDYPLGQFQNLEHVRLEWVHPNWFE